MSVCQETRTVNYRGETYSYTACFYLCEDSGEHFTTTAFDTEAMEQVYRQYRERNFIPSPEEIKAIRMRYRVSAAKMSRILGFGTNQYRLYENGEMPSIAVGRYLRLLEDPVVLLRVLRSAKAQFAEEEYRKLLKKIVR
jgi:DNA-binding transcriptional regulator YiaG